MPDGVLENEQGDVITEWIAAAIEAGLQAVQGVLDNENTENPFLDPEEIVSCELLYESRGVVFSSNHSREYVRKWRVIVRSKELQPIDVCYAPCIPFPYSPYVPTNGRPDLSAVLVHLEAEREHQDDYQSWIVTGRYSTDVSDSGPNANMRLGDSFIGPANHPELERPVIEWDEEESTEAPQYDLDGKAFLNSAFQPFTPAPTFPTSVPILVITRNQLTVDPLILAAYSYAVNSQVFLGNPAGTCLSLPPRGRLMYRGNTPFYRMTYRVKIKTTTRPDPDNPFEGIIRDTWQPRILDCGLYRLLKLNLFGAKLFNQPVPIFRMGHPITTPVLLDGEGGVLRPDTTDPANPVYTPVFKEFRRYQDQDLNNLFLNMGV